MSKLPAFQFYPADWRKDPGVQSLSYHDRGVWFEILCLMHESEQRGRLLLNGRPMPDEALARLLGLDKQILTKALTTLLDYGVASRDNQGALVNRRMVNDEKLRQIRTEAGKKGGNPSLVNKGKQTNLQVLDNQNSTPSSSSSSSTSFSSSDEKEKENGGGGNARAHTRGKPPPAAAVFTDFPKNRLWIELDGREKPMEFAEFATHLQTLRPKQNIRKIAEKLRAFCKANGKDFAHERLKGWVFGEGKSVSDAEFLAAFGIAPEEKPPPSLVELCPDCDSRGFVTVKIEGVERNTKCRHEKVKEKAKSFK